MPPPAAVAENLASVRRRIDAAARRARRDPDSITLVAVSKTFGADDVRRAVEAGQTVFGENKVQEGLGKIDALADTSLDWHLIGHLQSNKARKAVAGFTSIETIDSLDLLMKVDRAAADAGVTPRVFVQIDLANEATKHGTDTSTALSLVRAAVSATAVDCCGLMAIPPFPEQAEDSRPWFRQLRELRDRLLAEGIPAGRLRELSMGMSSDFEVAIEEGATVVRVGTALFGRRPPPTGTP
jgi:pyridoxal phosphate enzyme (YggS family)